MQRKPYYEVIDASRTTGKPFHDLSIAQHVAAQQPGSIVLLMSYRPGSGWHPSEVR